MPAFILNHGSPEAEHAFGHLDAFTQGYIEAMFFTSTGTGDDAETDLEHATVAELAPETLAAIIADCDSFISTFDKIEDTADDPGAWPDDAQAGRDFWYTRNGHGCGFWDGDWPEPFATALDTAARQFRSVDLYRGDNGRLYLT